MTSPVAVGWVGPPSAVGMGLNYLNGVHADCMATASEWETSQGSRAEELNALASAGNVIAKMTGVAES